MRALPTAPEPLPDSQANHHHHLVQFYERDDYLCETVADYLAAGLRAGETAVVIATRLHREALVQRLHARGLNLHRAREEGRIAWVDAGQMLERLIIRGRPDRDRFRASVGNLLQRQAAASPTRSVRAFGEMVDLLWRDGNPEAALQLEALWNELLRDLPVTLLCAYVMGNFYQEIHARPFAQVCEAHGRVRSAEPFVDVQGPEEQLRELAALQQRTRALEMEVEHHKRLEQVLRQTLARQWRADESRDELLAMLAHELRTPLAPILTAVQVLKLRVGEVAAKERAVIERQVEHLVRLVDDLLDASRIARDKLELRRRPVEVAEVVARALEQAGPLLEHRRHRLEVKVPDSGLRVEGDLLRLAQIVSNLLVNAAKYTEPGGAVEISARREGGVAVIAVRDTGIGISPELLPRVFDLFVQGGPSSAADSSQGGLGLGLAVVRSLAELHGGTVSASSDGPGRGSEMVVRLPLLSSGPAEGDPPDGVGPEKPEPPEQPERPERPPRKRILVVDDNADAAEILAELLETMGHTTRAAFDGLGAIKQAMELQPEVALLDIGLPLMDGYELALRLRELPGLSGLKLIATTGYGQERDRDRAAASGFDAHLVKPVEAEQIEHELIRLFGG